MTFLCFLKALHSQAHRHIPKGNLPGTQHPSQVLPHHPFYCPIEHVYAEMPGEKRQAQRSEAGRAELASGSPLGPVAEPPRQRQPSPLCYGMTPASSTACCPETGAPRGSLYALGRVFPFGSQERLQSYKTIMLPVFPACHWPSLFPLFFLF